MFGVLVVVLSPDHITDLGFSTGKCHILLIGSLRVLRSRLGTRGVRRPPVRASASLPVETCIIDREAVVVDQNGLSIFNLLRYRQHDTLRPYATST